MMFANEDNRSNSLKIVMLQKGLYWVVFYQEQIWKCFGFDYLARLSEMKFVACAISRNFS